MAVGKSSAHFGKGLHQLGGLRAVWDTWLMLATLSSIKVTSVSPLALPRVWQFLSCLAPGLQGAHAEHNLPMCCVSSQPAWPGRGPWRMRRSSKGSAGEGTATCCRPHPRMRNLPALSKTPAQLPAGLWGPAGIGLTPDTQPWQLLLWLVGMAPDRGRAQL